MKRISVIFVLTVLLATEQALAQSKDSVPAKKIIEQGTKGDIIVGNEKKKAQLNASPQPLKGDSLYPVHYKKKKCKRIKTN